MSNPTSTELTPIAAAEPDEAAVDSPEPPPAVVATGLALHGSRGLVYGPVDLVLPAASLLVVQGTQGAGRSSLLLTLAGRMVPDRGARLTVLGLDLPRARTQVQRRAAIAGFAGIDDLDESVRVSDLVRERLAWLTPWYHRVPPVTQRAFAAHASAVWGDRPIPRVGSMIWDLDEIDVMLLRITLAMAQRPDLLVVDDIDQVRDGVRRQFVWTRLEAIAAAGTTVIASVSSLGEAAAMSWVVPPQQLHLSTGPHAIAAA
ncbi:ATP-binding cassette domain-containing protein [Pengzhenrongella sicca]|uniref:AAA family ATPase n=1 Tax=Pengzhenrongella sicca TaxID=2819238 RepID=A0A8A4Z8P2_9MICO|nr:AAA family ATPase [Pengzhenrongella sicca]QTE28242.1 AAA family ATPase [Pengzhenrongella sicca]